MTRSEMLSIVANARGWSEVEVANRMTYRHLGVAAAAVAKVHLLAIDTIAGALSGIGGPAGREHPQRRDRGPSKVPVGFRQKAKNARYIDLDGPLGSVLAGLAPGVPGGRK